MALLKLHERDNVAVALRDIRQGETLAADNATVTAREDIPKGHKIALCDLQPGEHVIKYGFPIGHATSSVAAGQWLHSHNVRTNLGEILAYEYKPEPPAVSPVPCRHTFRGYRRPDGRVGVRNEIWIIPTVSCVNRTAQLLAERGSALARNMANIDGVFAFTHPYGCSQLGDDHRATQTILADLVNHPNAGAVLVLGLGCENNNVPEFQKVVGSYNADRVKFLVAQEVEDEIAAGLELLSDLIAYAGQFLREDCPASELVVGLKCGGSDAFSGITANPLVGAFSDLLIACGGSTVLTEVPEMFGAETILMNRAQDKAVFDKTVRLINDFKNYFMAYNQPIYENPSPGNKKGGITTLEEKSLGCTQKGGRATVVDVLGYGETVTRKGLNLLNGPGNDAVAATALAAAGCHLVLFTTGRGTPLGTAVPTVKIATNSELFRRKTTWMDFNAGELLEGKSLEALADEFFAYVLAVASGRPTKAEEMGFREIAIFKNGVTL
ncbi:Altronate dehydratase [Thermosinus carboxydivorans Nor1]|uniref:Altronate dehydratase n=1 Tax=Thermosinus carboxydivorans Nor1 TaxID=401526 RepID=A1HM19_9FIRM|nr:altronate dehydratase family protein [Thermosinus carboxydivorans]EAX48870.1 Altronate dehydratase [Thermosinus carboxydivorans Nor1]